MEISRLPHVVLAMCCLRTRSELYCTVHKQAGRSESSARSFDTRIIVTCSIAWDGNQFPNQRNNPSGSVLLVITTTPKKPFPYATAMARVPQLGASTQIQEGSSILARADLQFQSHQEHVQPLPLFLMPHLDVTTKPRLPSKALRPSKISPVQVLATSSDGLVKTAVDPLDDRRYLVVPIEVLCESVMTPRLFSPHDVAEAYCALFMRARHGISTTKDILRVDRIFAALEHIKAQASIVCAAMQRDIRLASVDPFLELRPRNCSSLASGSLPSSNAPPGVSFVERKLTVHEEKRGKDYSLVCIRALQFVSVVFYARPFQGLFSCAFSTRSFYHRPPTLPRSVQQNNFYCC